MPPAIKGLDNIQFMERGQSATYFSETEETEEYWKGENKMGNSNFENPAEKLHRRVMDILRDPSKAANYGEKLRDKTSYRQVLEIVLQEDPELAKIYGEGISPLQWEKRRKAKAQDAVNKIASLAREKMKDDATLSYGEALRKARDENPDLVEEYESWR
jgi:hypothetical protein